MLRRLRCKVIDVRGPLGQHEAMASAAVCFEHVGEDLLVPGVVGGKGAVESLRASGFRAMVLPFDPQNGAA